METQLLPTRKRAVSALGPTYPNYLDLENQLDVPERKTLNINRGNCTVGKIKIKTPSARFSFIKIPFSIVQWEKILGLEKAMETSMAKSEFQLSSVLSGHPSWGNMTKIMQLLK